MFEPVYLREPVKKTEGDFEAGAAVNAKPSKGRKKSLVLQFKGIEGTADAPAKTGDQECAEFLEEVTSKIEVTTASGIDYAFTVGRYTLPSQPGIKNFATILLPNPYTAELQTALEQFLADKYPDSMQSLEEKRQRKQVQRAAKVDSVDLPEIAPADLFDKMFAYWEKFSDHPITVKIKNGVRENAITQFVAGKISKWLEENPTGQKVQAGLTTLALWKGKALIKLREYKVKFNHKSILAREWSVFLSAHAKTYFTQMKREPQKWARGFIQAPSRYPSVLAVVSMATTMSFSHGISAVKYGLIAGAVTFAATHLRNYAYQQRYLFLQSKAPNGENITPGNPDEEPVKHESTEETAALNVNQAFDQGREAGKNWLPWAKSLLNKAAYTKLLDHGAGLHAGLQESLPKKSAKI